MQVKKAGKGWEINKKVVTLHSDFPIVEMKTTLQQTYPLGRQKRKQLRAILCGDTCASV